MATYTKRTCPKCGYVVEGWHMNNEFWRDHIGPAIEKCPKCKRYIRCGSNVEYIMIKKPKWFVTQYLLFDFFKSVLIGGLLGTLFWVNSENGNFFVYAAVCVAIIFGLHCLSLRVAINNSLKRTADYKYRYMLREMLLINERLLGTCDEENVSREND